MKNKADFIKRLHESDAFKKALSRARTNAERKRVTEAAETFVSAFADVLAPIIAKGEDDPEFIRQLAGTINEGHDLITINDPGTSGSSG